MRTFKQIQDYQKRYRKANKDRINESRRISRANKRRGKKKVSVFELEGDISEVLKNIPAPFGSFEKATYMIYMCKSSVPLYQFTTTCHNTEDCIEMIRQKFSEHLYTPKYCSIYKVQNGMKELIFRDIIRQ